MQTQTKAQDCVDSAECTELKLRVRSELRISENPDPTAGARTRERERIEEASGDTSDTVEPTATVELTGFVAWVHSMLSFIGL